MSVIFSIFLLLSETRKKENFKLYSETALILPRLTVLQKNPLGYLKYLKNNIFICRLITSHCDMITKLKSISLRDQIVHRIGEKTVVYRSLEHRNKTLKILNMLNLSARSLKTQHQNIK